MSQSTSESSYFTVSQTLIVTIDSVAADGMGVAFLDGFEFRVPGTAPGDRLKIRIEHISPHHPLAWARLEVVLHRGPEFRKPDCSHAAPLHGRCGGCPLSHLSPETQATVKELNIREGLKGLDISCEFHSAPTAIGYRNRSHRVVGRDANGAVILGSYAPRSHEIAEMRSCHVARTPLDAAIKAIAESMTAAQVPVYPEPAGARYITVRSSQTGEVLVELIVADGSAAWLEGFITTLSEIPEVIGVSVSSNDTKGNAMHTTAAMHRWGVSEVIEEIGPLEIQIGAGSFLQLNTEVAARMYARAGELGGARERVLDLYCGAGALGLSVAKAAGASLWGVEQHEEAVKLAANNAARAGVSAVFAAKDLQVELPPSEWPIAELVLVNPPRRGLDSNLRMWLNEYQAEDILYMSCNPRSFTRDAKDLQANGWFLIHLEAHDMLPLTTHVELLGHFRRETQE